jgi:hypothetical protein
MRAFNKQSAGNFHVSFLKDSDFAALRAIFVKVQEGIVKPNFVRNRPSPA